MYYISIKKITEDGSVSTRGKYLTDSGLVDKVKDAKKFNERSEASEFLVSWKKKHTEINFSEYSLFITKEVSYKKKEKLAVVTNERYIPIYAEKKSHNGLVAFFIIFFLCLGLSAGALYHHYYKPLTERIETTIANVKDGEQGPIGLTGETGAQGPKGDKGDIGLTGAKGEDGKDGYTPYIGSNGNWYINNQDTGIKVEGIQGEVGAQGEQGIQGEKGTDGLTPYIGENGHWFIGTTDTGYIAGVKSDLIPNNPIYEYTKTGNCDEGGFETYIDEHGDTVTYQYLPGEHKWDDETKTCLRDDTQVVFATDDYQMAICCHTACIWPVNGDTVGLEDNKSFADLFDALGVTVEKVIIKDGIKTISANAFKGCEDLVEVEFNNDLEYIGAYAFDDTNVTEFILPGTIKMFDPGIDRNYFSRDALNPDKVESIIILENTINPDDYAEIGLVAYSYDDPDTGEETSLDWNYYEKSTKYKNLTYFESYAKVKLGLMCFRSCTALEEVILHDDTIVGGWAFQGCTSLEYIDFTHITEIGEVAFQCCESLTEIYLPSTIVRMEKWVFDGSYNITDVYIEPETRPEGWNEAWTGTFNFIYTPKTPTWDNNSRIWDTTKTTLHWGVSEENPDGITIEENHN